MSVTNERQRDEFLDGLTIENLESFIEGLTAMVKYNKKSLKRQQERVNEARADHTCYGGFEDCGEFYYDLMRREEVIFDEMLSQKKSIEKYRKKAKHILREKLEAISNQ